VASERNRQVPARAGWASAVVYGHGQRCGDLGFIGRSPYFRVACYEPAVPTPGGAVGETNPFVLSRSTD